MSFIFCFCPENTSYVRANDEEEVVDQLTLLPSGNLGVCRPLRILSRLDRNNGQFFKAMEWQSMVVFLQRWNGDGL